MDYYFTVFYSLMLFLMMAGKDSYAQQATVTTGGTLSQATGSISYSVGVIPFNSHSTAVGSVTEGMFHIYRIKTPVKLPGIIQYDVNIFPNPTPDRINIRIKSQSTGNMTAVFCDIKGKSLKSIRIHEHHNQSLSLSQYSSGIYFLKILKNNTPIDTYKIIKL